MSSHYASPPSNLRALRDRLTATAKREGVVFGRLRQHVGVLVVAQFMEMLADERGEPLLLVKGGASLELRRRRRSCRVEPELSWTRQLHAANPQPQGRNQKVTSRRARQRGR